MNQMTLIIILEGLVGLGLILGSMAFLSYYVIKRLLDRCDKLTNAVMARTQADYLQLNKQDVALPVKVQESRPKRDDFIPIEAMDPADEEKFAQMNFTK